MVETHGKGIAGQLIPLVGDITVKKDILRLAEEVESKEKCLDILINNAGIETTGKITPDGETAEEFRDNLFHSEGQEFDNWADEYRTNVGQIYFMTGAFLPLIARSAEQRHGYAGTIINITSISGIVLKSQGHFSYNASKAAANHLTKMLASEIANKGVKVRINAIAPGVFPSEMTAGESKDNQKSELPKEKYAHLPSERPGKDSDMANAILFAATNQYLNGQIVPVDGGYLLKFGS